MNPTRIVLSSPSEAGEDLLNELLISTPDPSTKADYAIGTAPEQPQATVTVDKDKMSTESHAQWAVAANGKFIPVGKTIHTLQAGVYQPFSDPGMWGLEGVDISSDGIYILPDMATNTVLAEADKFWNSETKYRKHKLLFKRGILCWGPPGCLDKDAYIPYETRGPKGNRQSCKGASIERLYQVFHGKTGKGLGRYQKVKPGTEFFLGSIDDNGYVFKNRIIDVVSSGSKECFEITTSQGKRLIASGDHKFMSGDGYKPLSTLTIGDKVFIHTNNAIRVGEAKNQDKIRQEVYVKHHPIARTRLIGGKYVYHRLPRARAVVEASLNNLQYQDYIDKLNRGDIKDVIVVPKGNDVHHLNEDRSDDRLENLLVISHSDHAAEHGYERPVKYRVVEDTIISLVPVGPRETYDIVMEGPYNNYVADGLVVHNSGKSITIKLLMRELIQRDGIIIIAHNIALTLLCVKALRRIEPKRNLILVFEDIDEIIRSNSEAQVLSLLDGEANVDNVLYLASTNHPEKLGARIINRPSRFDRRVYVGLPAAAARRDYLSQATQGGLDGTLLDQWVEDTGGSEDIEESKWASIAHLRELIAAVYCLEQPYEETLKRLKTMTEPIKDGPDGFIKRAMGFGGNKAISNQLGPSKL